MNRKSTKMPTDPTTASTRKRTEFSSLQPTAMSISGSGAAVVVAFEVFADAVLDRDVLLFVDNRVAEGVVRNGYARRVAQDASALANLLWLRCAALKVCLYVKWVATDSNIADGPSRPNEPAKSAGLRSLGPRWEEVAPFPGR